MEKKTGNSSSNRSSDGRNSALQEKKKEKIFRNQGFHVGADDASIVLGSVIEKGFSGENSTSNSNRKPIKDPKIPEVPFPVARHRFHGSYTGAIDAGGGNGHDSDDVRDKDDEDGDLFEPHPIAAFANPVQRREKKDLNFSRWRELISNDSSSVANEKEVYALSSPKLDKLGKEREAINTSSSNESGALDPMEVDTDASYNSTMPVSKTVEMLSETSRCWSLDMSGEMASYSSLASGVQNKINNANHVEKEVRRGSASRRETSAQSFSCNYNTNILLEKNGNMSPMELESVDKQEQVTSNSAASSLKSCESSAVQIPTSIESEIDAENLSRLQTMSAEEISEAQAEIIEKMDSKLLNLLKKRGQEKLNKEKDSRADLAMRVKSISSKSESSSTEDAASSVNITGSDPDITTIASSKSSQNTRENDAGLDLGTSTAAPWNAWSDRVEAIRELRFSLDGNIIEADHLHLTGNGNSSVCSSQNSAQLDERDFLRTEGDPDAAGYTIKEAVALTRSVIPGQRTLALRLLASVLDKAINNICHNSASRTMGKAVVDNTNDWQAIWGFALGPEPELVLALRMCIDDNHSSVVLACIRVIEIILSCDLNEHFFDISERLAIFGKNICTAPVFRSKPEIDAGFLCGGFWKYSAKPSNMSPFDEDFMDEEAEEKNTIQDDIFVAGQDFAAGLVRMGVLPRIRFLFEMECTAALAEGLISILVALARHSPICSNAIIKCQRLVQTIANLFTTKSVDFQHFKLKSVRLMRVLAVFNRKVCLEFVQKGFFHTMTWHLFKGFSSFNHWVETGREHQKLSSALMIEQLRFWKVCIQHGCCISYFSDIYPTLCLWLNPPTLERLVVNNVFDEFTSISSEAFLVMEALARRLPNFYLQYDQTSEPPGDGTETWSWSCAGAIVKLALKWLVATSDFFGQQLRIQSELVSQDAFDTSCLWVYSAVIFLLARVLGSVIPEGVDSLDGDDKVPYLPEFIPEIGLEIIKHGFLKFPDANGVDNTGLSERRSFIEVLCHWREQPEIGKSLAAGGCIHGLIQVIVCIDHLIHLGSVTAEILPSEVYSFSKDEKILKDGIFKRSYSQWIDVLNLFMKLVTTEWQLFQSIESFGRGGPAPGVGVGWGVSGGGFWSSAVLLAQEDAACLIHLLELFQVVSVEESSTDKEMTFTIKQINSALAACLTAGPGNGIIVEKALGILLQEPVMKSLDLCVRRFIQSNKMKSFGWKYGAEDYRCFSATLASHFKDRWLLVKKKSQVLSANNSSGKNTKGSISLDTIHEDVVTSSSDQYFTSLAVEWAYQRLPIPVHWFLSPISTICDINRLKREKIPKFSDIVEDSVNILEVAKGGLFFLLGIEAISSFLPPDISSSLVGVPLIWKLHSLSMVLLLGMGVLEEEKGRDSFEALQEVYGQLLDKTKCDISNEQKLETSINLLPETRKKYHVEFLRYKSEIHETYATYIETLVEQFAAMSYGDSIYGRQVAVYLHRCTEAPVRLATWNALANACVLDLLPPLDKCIAGLEGYLEPIEDNESVLDAYLKSWVSGAIDKAATRGSMAYSLVLHHLSSFIFVSDANDKKSQRNKTVRSLLRDYSRKQKHEVMMLELIRYNKKRVFPQGSIIEGRFDILLSACEGNSSLLSEIEKLRSAHVDGL